MIHCHLTFVWVLFFWMEHNFLSLFNAWNIERAYITMLNYVSSQSFTIGLRTENISCSWFPTHHRPTKSRPGVNLSPNKSPFVPEKSHTHKKMRSKAHSCPFMLYELCWATIGLFYVYVGGNRTTPSLIQTIREFHWKSQLTCAAPGDELVQTISQRALECKVLLGI